MNNFHRLFLCILVSASLARPDAVQVFILAGQSQGVNYDNNAANLPSALQSAQTNVDFWYRSGWWPDNSTNGVISSGNAWVDLAPQAKAGTAFFSGLVPTGGSGFGPELTLGRDLAAGLPGQKIAIVKYTWNSTSLGQRTDREGWNVNDRAQIYDGMVVEVNSALSALTLAGHSPSVKGFFWIQGEGDQHLDTLYNAYEQNLTDLAAGVRSEWNSEMAVVISPLSTAQITPAWTDYNATGFTAVRDAQLAVGVAGPLNAFINTEDLSVISGTVHFNEASTQLIGERMAEAYLAIPEPSSLLLLSLGLLRIISYLRRRG